MQSDQLLYQQAVQYYQSKDLVNAERIVRQILSTNPSHAPSLHVMGIIALDVQQLEMAEELVRSAIAQQKNAPAYHFTLGRILVRRGKKEEAERSYKTAIALKPDYVDAQNNLATILIASDRKDEAFAILNNILQNNPDNIHALCNAASILYEKKDFQKSLEFYRRANSIDSFNDRIHYDIGRILCEMNQIEEGLTYLKKAHDLNPDNAEAALKIADIFRDMGDFEHSLPYYNKARKDDHYDYASGNIVDIYFKQGKFDLALQEAQRAVQDRPESSQNLNNLGTAYHKIKDYPEALKYYRKALDLNADDYHAYSNMANTLKDIGDTDGAIDAQKKSIALHPTPQTYSNLLLTMIYSGSLSPEELATTAREFGESLADPLLRKRAFNNDKEPDRKLKIGYVSPDFRDHAVSYFLKPVYEHDRNAFETYAYSKVEIPDDRTEDCKRHFDHWRDIRNMTDDQAADIIENDRIDILVDLAGHTANNGLMILARKPAPIQATWLGYTATTGMKSIDYRLTDAYAEPPGLTEHLNVESLWRLPDIFLAYNPRENSSDAADHPPFKDNGYITFGCFNNFTKVTDTVLKAWAAIMKATPRSKLLMEISGISNPVTRKSVENRFEKCGIALDRLILEPYKRENQYVLYNKIDIALDPFPCVGGTTSMDTLWMGVPFVTLAGKSFSSRMGVSILSNAGLGGLIAETIDDYILIATTLANDAAKLERIRHGLRDKVKNSPLMDHPKFTRDLEDAYREMWRIWVNNQ